MIKINTIFCLIFIMIFYFVFPLQIFSISNEKLQRKIFLIYLISFFSFLTTGTIANIKISKVTISVSLNLKNIKRKIFSTNFHNLPLSDIIINSLMLFPVGTSFNFLHLKNKKFWTKIFLTIIVGALIGTTIETIQFILPINRVSQISDVVFNITSTIFGCCFSEILIKNNKNQSLKKTKK